MTPKSKYVRLFFGSFLVSILSFMVMISNELTNTYDGMWKGTEYIEYDWPVSLGRWFWPVVGKIRKSISPEPFTSVLSIALFVAGACTIVYIFNKDHDREMKGLHYLIVLLVSVNIGISACLSYRFMSPTFAFGFLCSIAAVAAIFIESKRKVVRWCFSIVLIVLATASYQDYLGCFCVVAMLAFIWKLARKDRKREAFAWIAENGLVLLVGCVVYKLLWDMALLHYGIGAAAYRGADSVTLKTILYHLPKRIKDAYTEWITYFGATGSIRCNVFQNYSLYRLVYIVPCLMVISILCRAYKTGGDWKDRLCRLSLIIIAFLVLPIAANVALLLSPGGGGMAIHMTMPLIIVYPCVALICVSCLNDDGKKYPYYIGIITSVLFISFYANFLQVSIDQHIMLKSREDTTALMNRVFSDMESKGITGGENGYVFLGKPVDNPLYRKDEVWNYANDYAKYGAFWIEGNCNTQSYYGLLRDMGVNVNFNWDYNYWHELEDREEVKAMPCYPQDGYYKVIDGSVVVKLSQ